MKKLVLTDMLPEDKMKNISSSSLAVNVTVPSVCCLEIH